MQGVNVDHTTGTVQFYNNIAERSGGGVASCRSLKLTAYNIAPGSVLDRSRDPIPTAAYSKQDWDGCIISPTIGQPIPPVK
jgi:predicted outer membrane repeat protein